MPANGLLYIPPHSCVCSVGEMLKDGFMALAPANSGTTMTSPSEGATLVKGPAFGASLTATNTVDAWPTLRSDAERSGVASTSMVANLKTGWKTELGGTLTSPVIADGTVLVARSDAHQVHALDAASGEERWLFTAGARIDSPPTIHQGRALFGANDGCVYCLRLSDGALIWKFRAAPTVRSIVVRGQLESAWPISGSVLVVDDAVFFAAGRTSYLDGGMCLYKLDAATGKQLCVRPLDVEEDRRNSGKIGSGLLPDVLSTDGESIFMRNARFDLDLDQQKGDVPHLWSSGGFLDDSWWHRAYWQIGTFMNSGWGGWPKAGQRVPAGRLLVTNGKQVFGYGRTQYDIPGAHVGIDAEGVWGPIGKDQGRWTGYHLYGQTLKKSGDAKSRRQPGKPSANQPLWTRAVPIMGQALVMAGETLFLAGPANPLNDVPQTPEGTDPLVEALESRHDGRLLAVSATDGETVAEHDLGSSPVFDGMAAAEGKLILSLKDGNVVCLEEKESGIRGRDQGR